MLNAYCLETLVKLVTIPVSTCTYTVTLNMGGVIDLPQQSLLVCVVCMKAQL